MGRLAVTMIDVSETWEEQVEKNISSIELGDKIRRLRLKRSMGLVELGRRTSLSPSFLSQLETGRVVPTLRNLSRIALVFQKELHYFFRSNPQSCFRISRRNTRSRLTLSKRSGSMISESMRSLIPDQSLVPCIAEFPMSETNASFFPEVFEGEEFAYVMEGSIYIHAASNEATLEAGDVLWTSGNTTREYRCSAGQTAKLMIITCPLVK